LLIITFQASIAIIIIIIIIISTLTVDVFRRRSLKIMCRGVYNFTLWKFLLETPYTLKTGVLIALCQIIIIQSVIFIHARIQAHANGFTSIVLIVIIMSLLPLGSGLDDQEFDFWQGQSIFRFSKRPERF
jgi:hypothetical protein